MSDVDSYGKVLNFPRQWTSPMASSCREQVTESSARKGSKNKWRIFGSLFGLKQGVPGSIDCHPSGDFY